MSTATGIYAVNCCSVLLNNRGESPRVSLPGLANDAPLLFNINMKGRTINGKVPTMRREPLGCVCESFMILIWPFPKVASPAGHVPLSWALLN